MSTSFVAVYRGSSVASARLVAISCDPTLVLDVTTRILDDPAGPQPDPVVALLDHGRKRALRLMKEEAARAAD